jgi:Glycosyl hydrolase family 12
MKHFSFRLLLLTVTLSFMACKTLNKNISYSEMLSQASSQAQKLVSNSDYETCKQGDRKQFDGVILKNNLWGKSKLKNPDQAVLCSYKKDGLFGWKWQLPNNSGGVIGYPALQVGRNPFEKGASNVKEFPVQVSKIGKLPVKYDVETHVKFRKYNLSFDLWLTDVEQYSIGNIKTEIMIWEDYFDFTSFGKKVATIISPFGTYDVLEGHLENSKFAQDWQYIAFVRTVPRKKGEVDIAFFLEYLVSKGMISKEHYFTSIEFGNEIGNSSGITVVHQFDWSLEKN